MNAEYTARADDVREAAVALVNAYGGNVPDWIAGEAEQLWAACVAFEACPQLPRQENVWIVRGTHWTSPGEHLRAFTNRAQAIVFATQLVQRLASDLAGIDQPAPDDWEGALSQVQRRLVMSMADEETLESLTGSEVAELARCNVEILTVAVGA